MFIGLNIIFKKFSIFLRLNTAVEVFSDGDLLKLHG